MIIQTCFLRNRNTGDGFNLMHIVLQCLNRCLFVGLVIYICVAGAFVWQINHYPVTTTHQAVDGIVILTGGAERVDQGIKLLQDGSAKRVLISGVHPNVKLGELMALHHIPPALRDKIDLGFGAIDTAGNARETALWVQAHAIHSLIVVTSNYHMPRALLHLQAVLPPGTLMQPLAVIPPLLDQSGWYTQPKAWGLLGLAYNKYLLTWPEILLWRYKT